VDILLYFAAIGLALWAQARVNNAYSHFSKVPTENRKTGYDVARAILDANGLQDVQIQVSQKGLLSDHYDPKSNTGNSQMFVCITRQMLEVNTQNNEGIERCHS